MYIYIYISRYIYIYIYICTLKKKLGQRRLSKVCTSVTTCHGECHRSRLQMSETIPNPAAPILDMLRLSLQFQGQGIATVLLLCYRCLCSLHSSQMKLTMA